MRLERLVLGGEPVLVWTDEELEYIDAFFPHNKLGLVRTDDPCDSLVLKPVSELFKSVGYVGFDLKTYLRLGKAFKLPEFEQTFVCEETFNIFLKAKNNEFNLLEEREKGLYFPTLNYALLSLQ